METADRSPEPKGECKDEKTREDDGVLVVDISKGREKEAARRPVPKGRP